MTYTYQLLGSEWSKLSVEKKRPYYEVADILKYIHWQHFPDYKYRPRRKRNIERFSSKKTAGQDPGVSFSSACPQAQSMRPCPSAAPYPMCYELSPHAFLPVSSNGPLLKGTDPHLKVRHPQ
ncbi:hypothetical protein OYC64_020576 [Pagothenia borchgrevinki]|uniref:Sex-determining region Y protein n=1 Tax=Pagothenia borchgrevinki TaxID=8213 RepID=A0ABD2FM71_PAGBO